MLAHKYTVTLGGWYQRTTLHLTEIHDFFALGTSRLALNEKKLKDFHQNLGIKSADRLSENLEYVQAQTDEGIVIKYFEDGLYILELDSSDIHKAQISLSKYFGETFEPAISYIFSLGAPTPKILANIKINHPTAVSLRGMKLADFRLDTKKFGKTYSKFTAGKSTVYKTPGYIFVVSDANEELLDHLVETQVFFREFKDQLERYLNIHRSIWEEIADIKERGEVKGGEVSEIRVKLDSYQKTIDLITNRINQMGSYINTRRNIAKTEKIEDELDELFQYKFETLNDTHTYIKELWKMTSNYLDSATKIFTEMENKSTANNIRSLQVITTVGVISGILGYLARDEIPQVNVFGILYFAILLAATWGTNKAVSIVFARRKYKINFTERAKNI
ncbi:hypothetical protein ACFL2C_01890 [Patescibacteria group bacterium]